MSKISPTDCDRIRSHMGYDITIAIPVAAYIRLQRALDLDYSDYAIAGTNGIKYWLDRCDRYLVASDPTSAEQFTTRTQIIGDVNRSTTTIAVADINNWWELYLSQTDELAAKLTAPNFRRPETARHLFERWGDDYIKLIPGAPDNAVSDRVWFALNVI
jgi:hypothetical protein